MSDVTRETALHHKVVMSVAAPGGYSGGIINWTLKDILLSYTRRWLARRLFFFFFSSRRRHTRFDDWSSDVCSSDLVRSRQGQLLIHETSPVLATPILFGDVGALSFSSCSPARLSGRTSETNPP